MGQTLTAQFSTCLVIALLIALLLPEGHHGGLVDWLRAALVLGGLGQRAALHADFSVSFLSASSSGGVSYLGAPLLLTAVLLAFLASTTVLSERRRPSMDVRRAVGRAAVAATAYAAVWAVLAFLSHGGAGFGLGADALSGFAHLDVGLGVWSTLWHAFVLALLVGTVARTRAMLLSSPRVGARVRSWQDSIKAALLTVGLTSLLAMLIGLGWLVHAAASSGPGISDQLAQPASQLTNGEISSGLVALLLLLAHVANVVLVGAATVLGNAVGVTASAAGLGASTGTQGERFGILLGSGSLWWLLALCAAWLLVVLVGVRTGARAPYDETSWSPLGRYVTVTVATWLVITWATSVTVAASGSAGIGNVDGGAGFSARAGIGWVSCVLISCVVAALLHLGHRVVLPLLAAGAPRPLASLAGRGMHPTWALRLADATVRSGATPQPWLARMADGAAQLRVHPVAVNRRPLRILVGGLGVALIVVVGGNLLHQWLSTSVYGPEATIRSYFAALRDGDAKSALSQLHSPPSSPLLNDQVLRSIVKASPITQIDVLSSEISDNSSSVQVRYRQGDQTLTRTLDLTQDPNAGHLLGLLPGWKISSGALSELSVNVDPSFGDIGQVAVDGQTLPASDLQAGIPTFPGVVEVESNGSSVIAPTAQSVDLRDAASQPGSVQIAAAMRPEIQGEVNAAVTQALTACSASKELVPPGCPFDDTYATYFAGDALNVVWTVAQEPEVQVTLDNDGQVSFSGEATMSVAYVLQSSGAPSDPRHDPVPVSLSGTASINGTNASVTFDNVNASGAN